MNRGTCNDPTPCAECVNGIDCKLRKVVIIAISAKGKRKPVERHDNSPRTFPNREAARQYIRNHKYELTKPQIESSKAEE